MTCCIQHAQKEKLADFESYLVNPLGESFPTTRMGNITMQGDRTLYRTTIENVNEGINDLAGIDIMLIVITIGLVINIFSLKSGLITVTNMIT